MVSRWASTKIRGLLMVAWLLAAIASFVIVELRAVGREIQKHSDLVLKTDKQGFSQNGMSVTPSRISLVDEKSIESLGSPAPMPENTSLLKVELKLRYNSVKSSTKNACSFFVVTEDDKRWLAGDLVPVGTELEKGSASFCSPAYGTTYQRGKTIEDIEYFVLPTSALKKIESIEVSVPRRGKFSGNLLRRIPISGFEVSS